MNKIIDMMSFKAKQIAERAFHTWRSQFSESLDQRTKLTDLSDKTLAHLLQSGHDAQALIYDLIMGALALGSGTKFYYLDGHEKMRVLDISLFILDQIRFECMRRLGWITGFAAEYYPLVELITRFDEIKDQYANQTPLVLESNPDYMAYQQIFHSDREMFIRRQIPTAISSFLRSLPNGSTDVPEKE